MANFIPDFFAWDERVLLRELSHRINKELASGIAFVLSREYGADNPEVKTAPSNVIELCSSMLHRALTMPDRDILVDAAKPLASLV